MKWQPKDYQVRSLISMMQLPGVGLLFDPGMGKTSTALMAFTILKQQGHAKKALVITPIRPMYTTWPNEIKKWDDFNHLTHSIIHAGSKESGLRKKADIYLINPEGLKWLMAQKRLPEFDVLIVDECFQGTSKVSSSRGQVAIQDIELGELVETPEGFKKVLNKFKYLRSTAKVG